jgi:O-antigen/teichoic acid export membrane protein
MLTPTDFGYIAMATVVTEFAALFGKFGFTDVLIQRRTIRRLQVDTVFWASMAIGAALALSVLLLSFLADWFFGDPQVGPLMRVLCISFVLNSLVATPSVVLSRLLHFRTEFWIQTGTVLIRAIVAVTCAALGYGVWSLVAGSIAGSLASVLMYFIAVPYLPRLKFHLSYLTSTFSTSSFYFAGGLLYYLNMSIDLILVGRHLGATSLGFYQNARSLTDEIRARLAAPLAQVLFPAFSSLQGQASQQQHLFMRAARLLATVIFPLGFGVSATAPELVPVLYGPQWLDMVPLVVLFGISAALRGSTAIASPLLNASNRVGLTLKYNAINTVLMVVGVVVALPYGVNAVAAAVAFASLYPLVTYRVGIGVIGLNAGHMLRILVPPVAASGLMWAAIAGLRQAVGSPGDRLALQLVLYVAAGSVVYVLSLALISRQHLRDARDAVATLKKKRS